MVEKGTKKLKEMGMLEYIFYVRPEDPSGDYVTHIGPAYTSFTQAIRQMLVTGTPATVTSLVVAGAASRRDRHRAWLTDANGPGRPLKQWTPGDT